MAKEKEEQKKEETHLACWPPVSNPLHLSRLIHFAPVLKMWLFLELRPNDSRPVQRLLLLVPSFLTSSTFLSAANIGRDAPDFLYVFFSNFLPQARSGQSPVGSGFVGGGMHLAAFTTANCPRYSECGCRHHFLRPEHQKLEPL